MLKFTKINKKFGIVLLSLVISIVLFFVMYEVTLNTANPYGTKVVYYALKPISHGTEITKNNVNSYFSTEKIADKIIVNGFVTSEDDLIGKYVKNDIVQGQQISDQNLNATAGILKNIKDLREYSINFSDISEAVGGTIRPGDTIDIISTVSSQSQTTATTQLILKNILVDKAITSDGTIISKDEVGSKYAASKLTLDMSAENAAKLDNALALGKIKVMKVLDNSTSPDITINGSNANVNNNTNTNANVTSNNANSTNTNNNVQ